MTQERADPEDDFEKELLPSLSEILLDRSLYEAMPAAGGDEGKVDQLRKTNLKIDAYCIYCKDRSIFQTRRVVPQKPPVSISNSMHYSREPSSLAPGVFSCELHCLRCNGVYRYIFNKVRGFLIKIGQYPSLEDIGSASIEKYRKVLDKDDYAELKRATGLFSHGIGIGSFVYLRRIFERLINTHHAQLLSAGEGVEKFDALPMDKKIGAVAKVLPPALVENKSVYSILSVGIHALDEDTCRRYFPVVKAAILQILEQDVAAKAAKAAADNLKAELARIVGEVRG